MIENILDASAVLAVLQNENGREKVELILEISAISRVNVTEVLTKLVERGMAVNEAEAAFNDLKLKVVEFDESQSIKAAELRPLTKHLGLSLGDRCCLALAIQENATAVTADRNWASFNLCKVEVIR
ncbi:MAG: type II toxin-antitoxin system VapC family toxin [Acidobacteriota bacterium]|jgi:PIN domain nuclease of toxin-antitoxin system|nr:type II toxin-antitoxin system VapC family toxin [Acidobacteriota bacterium]